MDESYGILNIIKLHVQKKTYSYTECIKEQEIHNYKSVMYLLTVIYGSVCFKL